MKDMFEFGKKYLILIAVFLPALSAAQEKGNEISTSVTVLSLFCVGILLYTINLHFENSRLKKEVRSYRAALVEYKNFDKFQPIGVAKTGVNAGSVDQVLPEGESFNDRHAKSVYWERIGSTMDKTYQGSGELPKLQSRKKELEAMIELTKKKYHRREIDEKSFSEIIKDHQKQIIEIEARINKLAAENSK